MQVKNGTSSSASSSSSESALPTWTSGLSCADVSKGGITTPRYGRNSSPRHLQSRAPACPHPCDCFISHIIDSKACDWTYNWSLTACSMNIAICQRCFTRHPFTPTALSLEDCSN